MFETEGVSIFYFPPLIDENHIFNIGSISGTVLGTHERLGTRVKDTNKDNTKFRNIRVINRWILTIFIAIVQRTSKTKEHLKPRQLNHYPLQISRMYVCIY